MPTLDDLKKIGITNISTVIIEKVRQKAALIDRFHECLEARVCPKCGVDLTREEKFETKSNVKTGGTLFTCPSCNFEYKHNWRD